MPDFSVFARRREQYMNAIGPNAVALIHSPPMSSRNGDVVYPYRQSSDLYYLTGFAEPGATAILRPGADEQKFVLFVRPRDPERETWDGRRAGVEGATAIYGADVAFANTELDGKLHTLISNFDHLYYSLGDNGAFDGKVTRTIAKLRNMEKRGFRPPKAVFDPRCVLHEMRLRKTDDEIALLRKAANITAEAHVRAMKIGRPGRSEYEIEAELNYGFRKHGASGPGYTTIVGAGANGTILHYIENTDVLGETDLVLVDAGCEYDFYTADITRTFPASGQFSALQKQCYEIVLHAQKTAIEMVRPGVTLQEIHERVVAILTEGMVELGLLEGPVEERIADQTYKTYYMHTTSHWLGMDVHDVGAYTDNGTPRPLEPGMVITIEPGLYIAETDETAPEALRGIGIRIEDDILVTADGNENLTAAAPKEVADIEAICQSRN